MGKMEELRAKEAEIIREFEIGNLTKLGVANHLRRAGFNLTYATDRANTLAALPSGDEQGAEVVEWPGRQFCEIAERNISKLGDKLKHKDDKRVAFDAAQAIHALLASPTKAGEVSEALRSAMGMCEQYADFIRRVPAADLEQHPYLPELEQVIEVARAALSLPDEGGKPKKRCHKCHAPRTGEICHKCGGPLEKVAEGWAEPRLPPIDKIRRLAESVGYALGVHGSLERDLDLIAAPWVDEAVSAEELAQHIATALGATVLDPGMKPLGRWACNIQMDGWYKLIDLSVAPRLPAPPSPEEDA